MSFLDKLKTNKKIKEDGDSLGGGGALPSGLYPATIKMAYFDESKNGAISVNIQAATDDGKQIRQTFWVTNRKKENFYTGKDGTEHYLPGFNQANALALLTVGFGLGDLDEPEEKSLKLYDFDLKKEVPQKKECLTQLINQKVILGVQRVIEDKTKLNETTNQYEATGETRTINEIDKVFHFDTRMTVSEITAEADEAAFIDAWSEKWKDNDRNKAKGAAAGGAVNGAPGASTPAPKKSLFNKS